MANATQIPPQPKHFALFLGLRFGSDVIKEIQASCTSPRHDPHLTMRHSPMLFFAQVAPMIFSDKQLRKDLPPSWVSCGLRFGVSHEVTRV